jgi:acetate kinase
MNRGKYDISVITCHLGNGCSMAAVMKGRSVDTSMGLTPLPGLVMGTRSGDFDPAIIFFLERKGYSTNDLDKLLNKESGLLGVSGLSNDVRDLEAKAEAGNPRAKLALDIFAYRIKQYIGAYLAALNGCDGIVFTGGIGENGARMRKRILDNMESLGIRLDEQANAATVGKEGQVQAADSKVRIFVIPTNEEVAIARDTYTIASGQEA